MEYPALGTSKEGVGSIILCVIFECLAITAIFFRVWSRRLKGVALIFNDYAAIAATVCARTLIRKKHCANHESKFLTTGLFAVTVTCKYDDSWC